MSSKIENVIIWGSLLAFLAWLFASYFGFEPIIRNSFLSGIVAGTCILVICFYAIYWSLDIRKSLSSKIYRNQALGMALIAAVMALFDFLVFMDGLNINPALNVTLGVGVTGTSLGTVVVAIAYWVDISIRATQRSDPLLRDPLRWRYFRWVLWSMVLVFEIFAEALIIFFPTSAIADSILNKGGGGATIILAIFCGVLYIPISLSVSPDKTIRSHFIWFVLFLVSIIVGFFFVNSIVYESFHSTGFGTGLAVLFGSYCIYRSAKALGRLQKRSVPVKAN
jgi:hypothetical protein